LLATRTGERDSVQGQFDQFRNGIKALLGQAETAGTPRPSPVASTSE
jgi:hypothetical protein